MDLNDAGERRHELDDRSASNSKIAAQADWLLFRRDPFFGSKRLEADSVIKRRLQIAAGMIAQASVKALVDAGSGERELQRFLKTDLSIFGEAYAKPDDEYICFSEFPLARSTPQVRIESWDTWLRRLQRA